MILLYRLGNAITVPYVNTELLSQYFQQQMRDTVLAFINTMSGSALERASIFALSIQPYINASIIIQLLTVAIPALERIQKEGGEEGKKKLEQITRYSTIGIAALQGYGYYVLINTGGGTGSSMLDPGATGLWPPIVIVATFMTGSALLMWMGEQITELDRKSVV